MSIQSSIQENVQLRLQFLSRVVERECVHLNRTTGRLFAEAFTIDRARQLDIDDDLSERLEAFTSRFSRLQDTLGDKLIPQLLLALGEKPLTMMDNLDKAERLGWITDADEWQSIRLLRNQMVHEYIEDLNILTSAIQAAELFVPLLNEVAKNLLTVLEKRGWLVND